MELQVELVSWEMIKPATPTPPHLKRFNLCLLNQLAPLDYGQKINCYAPPHNFNKADYAHTTIARLKHSFSRALSVFYPIAGRLTMDESAVDCNDAGVPFIAAQCGFPLSLFLNAPNRIDMAWRFLPTIIPPVIGDLHLQATISRSRSLLVTELVPYAIQVTFFNCGGAIIGIKQLTKFLDASTTGIFLQTWCDYFAGEEQLVLKKPDFASATSLFPPRAWAVVSPPRPPMLVCDLDGIQADGPCIVKVFEFSPHSLTILQAKARSDLVPNPTRVEALSGFIWKHVMLAAAVSATGFSKNAIKCGPSVVSHALNIRPRISPKLSQTAIGNLVIHAIAYYKGQSLDNHHGHSEGCKNAGAPELCYLVAEVARALVKVKDPEFLQKLQGDQGGEAIRQYKHKIASLKDDSTTTNSFYKFASWNWISGLTPEFGFGKQVWSGFTGGRKSTSYKNLIVLIGKPDHGIEASIILDEKEMNCLQSDPEFLAFASLVGRRSSNLSKM